MLGRDLPCADYNPVDGYTSDPYAVLRASHKRAYAVLERFFEYRFVDKVLMEYFEYFVIDFLASSYWLMLSFMGIHFP